VQTRSHFTQILQNYFDRNDPRVRSEPFGFPAAVLNSFGQQLEHLWRRYRREAAAIDTVSCPVQTDNRGVYYAIHLGAGQELPSRFSVKGRIGSSWFDLEEISTQDPVPAGLVVDTDRQRIPCSESRILPASGNAGSAAFSAPFPLPFRPWLESSSAVLELFGRVSIQGTLHPDLPWFARKTTENLQAVGFPFLQSRRIWSRVDRILWPNLGSDHSWTVWPSTMGMPQVPDGMLPVVLAEDRDRQYPGFWSFNGDLLIHSVWRDSHKGFEVLRADRLPAGITSVAPFPDVPFLAVSSAGSVFIVDRREIFPESYRNLPPRSAPVAWMAVSRHPDFLERPNSLLVRIAVDAEWQPDWRWRLNVILPDGERAILVLDPVFKRWITGPFSVSAGWNAGAPPGEIRVDLADEGDYLLLLELVGPQGFRSEDVVAWRIGSLRILAGFDTRQLVDEIRGLMFDHLGRLWAWNGDFLIPLRFLYNLWSVSPDRRTIFVSRLFDEVKVE